MKTLTIERSKWLRGKGHGTGQLCRKADGHMCCLGFAGRQLCDATQEEIVGGGTPGDRPAVYSRGLSWLLGVRRMHWSLDRNYPSVEGDELIDINDDDGLADVDREKQIAEVFARHDIEVKFIP